MSERHRLLLRLVRGVERVSGRRRLAQLARLVTNEVRRDGANDLRSNGERLVQRAARTYPDPVVLDVGAHFGEWSLSLLAAPGNVPKVHAFEPSAYSAARARAALDGVAEEHQLALSEHAGSMELIVVHEGAGSNSLVPFADAGRASGDREQVQVSTLDAFCAERDLRRVTLVKIDAEGHDLAVLRGAERMLAEHRVDLVQFEYNHRWIDARAFLLDTFVLLQRHGYALAKVTPTGVEVYPHWHSELETFREGNYLAYLPAARPPLRAFAWWGP